MCVSWGVSKDKGILGKNQHRKNLIDERNYRVLDIQKWQIILQICEDK